MMQQAQANWLRLTAKELQKEIHTFLTAKNKPFLSLPRPLQRQSQMRAIITMKYVLPLINQTPIQTKSKQLLIKMLVEILADSKVSIDSVVKFFNSPKECELASSIANETTLLNIFSKMVPLPTHIINLLSDPKVNTSAFSLKEIQKLKNQLYTNMIQALTQLNIEERLIIINKLLVLKEEKVVVNYLIENNKQFLISNFSNLSKQTNIIKYLYKTYLTSKLQKEHIKQILVDISNFVANISSSLISLLSLNQSFFYSGRKYQQFYNIFYHTKQRKQITQQLLLWWAVSKNFIVTSTQAKARCNILAMITQNMPKQELYHNNYLVSLTEGIKKRLTDGSSKDFAILIWKMIGKKLQIKLTDEIEKADYFVIQEQKVHIVQHVEAQSKVSLQQQNNKISQNEIPPKDKENESQPKQSIQQQQHDDVIRIQPKNIYDCILCLRNPHRKDIAIKKLPQIIKKYKEDLVLMWNMLLRELLSPIKEEYIAILVELFTLKPQDFIDAVVTFFMNRENNISQKTYLIEILKQGIDELSSTQEENEQTDEQNFYFKKVKSKYFKEPEANTKSLLEVEEKQERTRRWGHTRIAHEKATKGIHIDFLKKQISANRFYPIANLLYFKIIDIMSLNLIENLRSHQVYVHQLLKLIAVFVSNIKNHFDKYIVISDAANLCLKLIKELIQNSKRANDRYEETGGMTLMLTLQILNKISLVIDHYAPENIMETLKQSMQGSRKLPNYGMSSVIHMIESNIYQRVYMPATQ